MTKVEESQTKAEELLKLTPCSEMIQEQQHRVDSK